MDIPVEAQEINTFSKDLEVVRIPFSGFPIRLEKIPLVDVSPGGINKDEFKDFERKLGHIPDLRSHTNPKDFSWAHRSLVGISATNVPESWAEDKDGRKTTWKRDYMMYLCVDKGAGLPQNKYLHKRLDETKEGRGARQDLDVYGDAFVFKKKPKSKGPDVSERAESTHMDEHFVKEEPSLKSPDMLERAEYIHMDQEFVDSAKYAFQGKIILENLLRVSTEGDFDYV